MWVKLLRCLQRGGFLSAGLGSRGSVLLDDVKNKVVLRERRASGFGVRGGKTEGFPRLRRGRLT